MAKAKKQRLDETLLNRGLSETIELARAFIMEGRVLVNDQLADKASVMCSPDDEVRLRNLSKFVSRGGDKLEGALIDLGIADDLKGSVVLDIGASTGGFTDCCLKYGAKKVIALDVGSNQLAWKLRTDPRVVAIEQCDIRDFEREKFEKVDWVVADISFNSIGRLLPAIRAAAPHAGVRFLCLVKPQFELERDEVEAGGVITDDQLRKLALERVIQEFARIGLVGGRSVDSRIEGAKGNREIFYYVLA